MNNVFNQAEINQQTTQNGDEYPTIWYYPSRDQEDKRAQRQEGKPIHLFSQFGEVVKFTQSLEISFLLILPTEEQKLLEGLKALKEAYGRRLTDFEEDSVLKEFVSEETRKIFKVYVFYTRGDFESEEISVENDAKETVRQFREEYIFWERKKRDLEKEDAVFQASKESQGFGVFRKFQDYVDSKEFYRKKLAKLARQRKREKEKKKR